MKKTIRLTESELTNLIKRIVNETSVTELPSGDVLLGGDSFFGGEPRRREMTNMEHAEVGLKGALMMMKFLPEKITNQDMEQIKLQTEMLISNALFLSRNNEEEMEVFFENMKNTFKMSESFEEQLFSFYKENDIKTLTKDYINLFFEEHPDILKKLNEFWKDFK